MDSDKFHEDNKVPSPPSKVEENFVDYSILDTPKLDVSGIKLESAQKEKNSFLEELKKQSFILSVSSTQKFDAKDSINA